MVPRYFAASLQRKNEAKLADDLRHAALVAEIAAIKSKRYKSRSFPATLRSLIFERDGYRCCNCGKHREELVKLGLQLEVDHILAVVDGGFTEYSNGETLCSECNIAKHHNKHFYALMRQIRRPAAAACAA
jgi:5-methylcytosine-specific restriction endonuclease McrA